MKRRRRTRKVSPKIFKISDNNKHTLRVLDSKIKEAEEEVKRLKVQKELLATIILNEHYVGDKPFHFNQNYDLQEIIIVPVKIKK